MITIVGSYVSPFVRKVLACLELEQLDYRIDPITPFFGADAPRRGVMSVAPP
jgi:glutathione S-transferase